jgi:hypothetical protein
MNLVEWKDADIVDLIESLGENVEIDDACFGEGAAAIIAFINNNRKCVKRRKIRMNLIQDNFNQLIKPFL